MMRFVLSLLLFFLNIIFGYSQYVLKSDQFKSNGSYYAPGFDENNDNGQLTVESRNLFYCTDKKGNYLTNCANAFQFQIYNSGNGYIQSFKYKCRVVDGSGQEIFNKIYKFDGAIPQGARQNIKEFLKKDIKSKYDFRVHQPHIYIEFEEIVLDLNNTINKLYDKIPDDICIYPSIQDRYKIIKSNYGIDNYQYIDDQLINRKKKINEKLTYYFNLFNSFMTNMDDNYVHNFAVKYYDINGKENRLTSEIFTYVLKKYKNKLLNVKVDECGLGCFVDILEKNQPILIVPIYISNSEGKIIKRKFCYYNYTEYRYNYFYQIVDQDLDNDELSKLDKTNILKESDFSDILKGEEQKGIKYLIINSYAIKIYDGTFISCNKYGDISLRDKELSNKNKFEFIQLESGEYIIKNIYGKYFINEEGQCKVDIFSRYINDDKGYPTKVVDSIANIKLAAKFILELQKDGKYVMKANGKYLEADKRISDRLYIQSNKVSEQSKFELINFK